MCVVQREISFAFGGIGVSLLLEPAGVRSSPSGDPFGSNFV